MIKTLSDALAERGYDTLTSVQEAVTAPELQEADLLVSAQTGSGKTVGFGLAIAHTLMGADEQLPPAAAPLALVVAPTRELALQVMRELGWLYAKTGARVVSCVGGMDMRDERRTLDRGAHIVVGTPGRLRDHIQRGSLDMSSLRAIVLDEADEMLDLGFREDLEFMLGEAPQDRRTLMFSATVPPMIATLAKHYQRDAVRVTTTTGASQHADITYQALRVAQADAENAIINTLRYHDAQNAIVFANTRMAVSRLTARFANRGFAVVSLSGELSQTERTHALQAMRDGRARVCVATDVAARGIDLPGLELVIHADLPSNPDALLHRSGRTGRAGRKGISALIVPPKLARKAERLLKSARIEAEWVLAPTAEEILRRDEERLLADPIWAEEVTEEQQVFAAKLLSLHAPETIAAAYLRLHRSRQSAPEDLSPPDAVPARAERKPFGPSAWFALSVGRNDRAEARWLLPLLCRAGRLGKGAIGAIRVQSSETYVEISQASAEAFLGALGAGGELEEGVTVRQLDAAPDMGAPRSAPAPRSGDDARAHRNADASQKSATPRAIRPHRADSDAPSSTDRPYSPAQSHRPGAKPKSRPHTGAAATPRPRADSVGAAPDAPGHAPAHPAGPKGPRPGQSPVKPVRAKDRKDASSKPHSARPRPEKPWAEKPRSEKPRSEKNRGPKPHSAKPAPKSTELYPGALDTSKRLTRPGKPSRAGASGPKTGQRKTGKHSGNEPPRRGKR